MEGNRAFIAGKEDAGSNMVRANADPRSPAKQGLWEAGKRLFPLHDLGSGLKKWSKHPCGRIDAHRSRQAPSRALAESCRITCSKVCVNPVRYGR
ncbi:hypothetical protein IAQ61_009567 [Plenodomus lingam]|uniref:uncharacterized protein n=1 Tax=Leptosphaeria maculans TaxID=5022 RepID=UPI00332DC6C5|nr:hypothetical protein IAQ61_009567 [Plenodomus lingam]